MDWPGVAGYQNARKSGTEVLKKLGINGADIAVIINTGVGDGTVAVDAMRKEAFDYLMNCSM